jgi:hypothetical protein
LLQFHTQVLVGQVSRWASFYAATNEAVAVRRRGQTLRSVTLGRGAALAALGLRSYERLGRTNLLDSVH